MPLLLQQPWSDMTETFCNRRERFPGGIEVLGAERSNDMHEACFWREIPGDAHAKAGDNDIRRGNFGTEVNDLRSVHKLCVRSKGLAEDREVNDKGRGATYLRSRSTVPRSCRYFTPDKVKLGIIRKASVSHCYESVKNDQTY